MDRRVVSLFTAIFALVTASILAVGRAQVSVGGGYSDRALGYLPSQPVGNLNGTFTVDGNGSATYVLPLEVPPGTAGAAPSLQLTYDSHRSNGYVGMGWGLSGISAITRCGATYRIDGFKAGVAYDGRDRFCLDGRRLIAVSGQNGGDGTVYHTEIETWTIVTSHGVCGSGPCSFTATNKDGNALSFGGTTGPAGSRILAQGRSDQSVRTWSIDANVDRNGNTVGISYVSDVARGEYYPAHIDYTSNAQTLLKSQRSVQFGYISRPDIVRTFDGGSQVQISKLLATITTHVTYQGGDQTILAYKMAYQQSAATGRSRLASVSVCDGAGTCWPPTVMDWNTAAESFQDSTTQLPGPTYVILDGRLYPFGRLMDINGDGIADYCAGVEFADGRTDLRIYLGSKDGSFTLAPYQLPGPIWRVFPENVVQVGVLQDINGDGILDYSHALRNEDAGTSDYTVYLGTGQGFTKDPDYQLPGPLFWQVNGQTLHSGVLEDMNGDGIPDYSRATLLLATGEQMLDIHRGTGSGFTPTGTKLPGPLYAIDSDTNRSIEFGVLRDINGDGIADFSAAMVNADSGTKDLRVFLGHSPDFTFNESYNLPGQMLWLVNGQTLESGALVDLNGDGIPDYSRATRLEATGEQILDVYLGTGAGFTRSVFQLPGPLYSILDNTSYIQGLLTDWNSDGTTRYSRATQWADGRQDLSVHLGAGTGFRPAGYALPKAIFKVVDTGTYANATYEDVNGDGLTDFVDSVCLLNRDGSFGNCTLGVRLAAGPFSDLMKSITNGFGGSTGIEYAPLTGGIYQETGASGYPIRNSEGPMIVVSRFTNSDGRGNSYSYSYRYAGARTDVLGRGWLGFASITTTEDADGRSQKVNYEQTTPYFGLVASSQTVSGAGGLMAQSDFAYADIATPALRQLGIHEPVRTREAFTQYTDGQANYTLRKEYLYDGYGNITITSDLGDVATPDDDVYICVRYSNDAATGRYGFRLQSKIDRTKEGCEVFVNTIDPAMIVWVPSADLRWTKTSYDSRMNIVAESGYDDSNGVFLTDRFAFDGVGNILTATNASGDTTSYSYDPVYQTFRTTIVSPQLTRNGQPYRLTTLTIHEPGFGVLTATTDPNGNVTSQRIDGFGRPVEVYGSRENGAAPLLVTSYWAAANGAYYLLTRQRPDWSNDNQDTWYWDKAYFDGLSREYRTERSGLKQASPAVIAENMSFDSVGRIAATTAPHYVGDAAPATTTEYDAYNRPVLTTDPAGVMLKIDYSDGGLKITRTSAYDTADAQTEISYLTGRGEVRQKVDPNGLTTDFTYDKIGQLIRAQTSPEARITQIAYDSFGRRLRVETPNTGVARWRFDDQGHLTESTDGAGNTIVYSSYDAMGRVRQRSLSYVGGSSSTAFTYDDPNNSNGLGNLTEVNTTAAPLGTFTYVYDYNAYGEAKAGATIVLGDRYSYSSSYDPLGRVVNATYPDGAALSMSYLTDSNLGSISLRETPSSPLTRYMTYDDYTALGQVQQTRFDVPKITVQQTYYPAGESFPQLKTSEAKRADIALYSRKYSWNKLSSLVAAEEPARAAGTERYGYQNQPLNQHMGFLTSATGLYGSLGYQYDRIGNTTTKPGVTIHYVSGKDWLASTSTGAAYDYYGNGNLRTSRENGVVSQYAYDSGGLLVRVDQTPTGGGPTQSGYATYDADGRQIFFQRVGEARKTFRITNYYEVVDLGNGDFQHTIYIPGQSGPTAAITKAGKGNAAAGAPRRTSNDSGWKDAFLNLLGGTSGESAAGIGDRHAPRAYFGMLALVGLLCALVLLADILVRATAGVAAFRTAAARRRPFFAAIAPLVALCFFIVSIAPAPADLIPGANGTGVPVPGYLFFIPNHLDSTVVTVDEKGTVTGNVGYFPDGGIDQADSSGIDNFRPKFVGAEWDPKTALYRMGMRQYAPGVGRFLTPDPAGQFSSPYTYAGNDPVSAIDPNGDSAFLVAMVIGAVVGTYFGAATVNQDMNPIHWDWSSGKTYAGALAGTVIGSVGAAAGGVAVQAGVAIGSSGGLAAQAGGIAVGILGQALVGAGENAAFTALGGGSDKDILVAAGEGALFGALFAAGGEALGAASAQFARRSSGIAGGAEEALSGGARQEATVTREAAGAVCGLSFAAGTPVLSEGGVRPIEQIAVGDRVIGHDLNASTDGLHEVAELLRRETNDLVTVALASGHSVTTTPEHPFRGYKRGWIPAAHLGSGDLLAGSGGEPVAVASVAQHHSEAPVTVYNLAVADVHNYRVGDGVLVHNGRVCNASINAKGVVTYQWSVSELQIRAPNKLSAIKRDIRLKTRNSNKLITKLTPYTRVTNPVKRATRQWINAEWQRRFGSAPKPSDSTSDLLDILRPKYNFGKQHVDESISLIQGGLTIRDGVPENQTILNGMVNMAHGGATGALARAGPPRQIFRYRDVFVPSIP